MNRLRRFLESIVFAGMRPGRQAVPKAQPGLLGRLRTPIERLLSGGPAPSDPLYLTNRSFFQRIRLWTLIAVPSVILVAGVAYTLRTLDRPTPAPAREPTAAEITARLLPDLQKEIKLGPAPDVQVLEIYVSGMQVSGAIRNTSTHDIPRVKLVISLTDDIGSQVGAVETTLENVAASARKEFRFPIKQRNAVSGIVRDIVTQ